MAEQGGRSAVRFAAVIGLFAVALAVVMVVGLWCGTAEVGLADAWHALRDPAGREGSVAYQILIRQRLPRVVLGALVGIGLGLAGASFQAILRNPLADPYTLGVASGSAVGAVVAISLPFSFHFGPFTSVQLAALLGAAVIVGVIYRLGVRGRRFRIEALLLGGVTVALVSSSLIMLVRTLVDPLHLVAIDRWTMGGLVVVGARDIAAVLPLLLPGAVAILGLAGPFNQLALGEELAFGRGVEPEAVQKWAFFAGSLVTAATVSVAGPIGFVGLIVPHAVRRVIGPDHRLLLPCAALAAGAFLVLCDTLGRTVLAPTELPVGVVTAVIGGPVFVLLLLRTSDRQL